MSLVVPPPTTDSTACSTPDITTHINGTDPFSTSPQPQLESPSPPTLPPLHTRLSSIAHDIREISLSMSNPSEVSVEVEGRDTPALAVVSLEVDLGALRARLDGIEERQRTLEAKLDALRGKGAGGEGEEKGEVLDVGELLKRVEKLETALKVDQSRLYARVYNATVPTQKTPLKAVPTGTGKPPPNFPATRGEFEHMTRERYEALLKAYGQPIKGDDHAKRESLREFLCLLTR